MNKLRVSLLFISFLISTHLLSQENEKLDSLLISYQNELSDSIKVDMLDEICQIVLYSNPKIAYEYAHEMIIISKKIKNKKGIAQGHYRKGGYYLNFHKIDSAFFHYKKALHIYKEINNLKGIISLNNEIGIIYMNKSEFDKALEFLFKNVSLYENRSDASHDDDFKYLGSTFQNISSIYIDQGKYRLALKEALTALNFYKATGEELLVADGLNLLGVIESELNNYDKSIDYYKSAQKIYHKHNDIVFECRALNNIGLILKSQHKYSEAIEYLFKAIDITKVNNLHALHAGFLNNVGHAYLKNNDTENALKYLNESLSIWNSIKHPTQLHITYKFLGELYNEKKDPIKAIYYLNKGITIADSIGAFSNLGTSYLQRSKSYELLNENNKALADYKLYHSIYDSIFNTTKSQQIEELRTLHEMDKKEQQISLQQNEIKILEQEAKVNSLERSLLATGVVLLFIVLGFTFYTYRQKIKQNKLERDKVDMELIHKKKELTTHALHIAKKNELLDNLKSQINELKSKEDNTPEYLQIIRSIDFDLQDDNNWQNFRKYFEEVHIDFHLNAKKKYPDITPNELRLMALLKMNLSSKEIANILNISLDGIKKARQRLRRKMNLPPEKSLEDSVLEI